MMAHGQADDGNDQPVELRGEILDSHCHAWRLWPYPPLVPDETTRGSVERLIYEMDVHGVQQAAVVCAGIENNRDNVEYVSFAHDRYRGRIHILADLDCTWHSTYHAAGAADRLRTLADRYPLLGFTHYVTDDNDGWLASDEAKAVFAVAAERNLLVSVAASPAWQADLRKIASRYPAVPVLCHHLGGITVAGPAAAQGLAEVLASAACPNIMIKVSGFHYASERGWEYPWPRAVAAFRQIFDAYGPHRLCWGSDFPASTRYCTYQQSFEVLRRHCDFLSPADRRTIYGEAFQHLIETRRPPS
jgi:predicted TIM-barrel fold metal-dependent hydrolase